MARGGCCSAGTGLCQKPCITCAGGRHICSERVHNVTTGHKRPSRSTHTLTKTPPHGKGRPQPRGCASFPLCMSMTLTRPLLSGIMRRTSNVCGNAWASRLRVTVHGTCARCAQKGDRELCFGRLKAGLPKRVLCLENGDLLVHGQGCRGSCMSPFSRRLRVEASPMADCPRNFGVHGWPLLLLAIG